MSVYNIDKIAPFLRSGFNRRVDIAHIGDSTELFGGHGRNEAYHVAFGKYYGFYRTGTQSVNENQAVGARSGWQYQTNNNGARVGNYSGVIDAYNRFMPPGFLTPANYWYLADADTETASATAGITIQGGSGSILNLDAQLRYHITWGDFSSGSGSWQPAIRLGQAPFTVYQAASTITTGAGVVGLQDYALNLAAAAGRNNLPMNCLINAAGTNVEGPCIFFWNFLEEVQKTKGCGVTVCMGHSGAGFRFMAEKAAGTDAMREFCRQMVRVQNNTPTALFILNSGVNDRNDSNPSVIRGFVSSTPSGYADNLGALINRIETAWISQGYSLNNLYFLLMPSTPISQPDDSQLVIYRRICRDFSNTLPRTAFVDLNELCSDYMFANPSSVFASASDLVHLKQAGYRQDISMAVDKMMSLI